MTEQEFRDALKMRIGSTGLSSQRQWKVLARMKGEERRVRTWSKMKISLVLAMALLLGMTGAVAGGLGGVDWNGEPAAPPPMVSINETEAGARMTELIGVSEESAVTVIVDLSPELGVVGGMSGMTSDYYAASLEEMKTWVEADGTLAWPDFIPEGYSLKLGRVSYNCDTRGGMKLISKETTEDGYLIACFELPEEHRFMSSYFMRLINDEGAEVTIRLGLDYGNGVYSSFEAGEDSQVTTPRVKGMLNTIQIDTPEDTMLAMRRNLLPTKIFYSVDLSLAGDVYERENLYCGATYKITTTDKSMTSADLLAIFGLTAE